MIIDYDCPVCGWKGQVQAEEGELIHCPACLSSVHERNEDDIECGGTYEPVSLWVRDDKEMELILRCSFCGHMVTSPVRKKDNPVRILEIAAQPLANPPFPVERIKELTKLMGGRGEIRWPEGEDEQGK